MLLVFLILLLCALGNCEKLKPIEQTIHVNKKATCITNIIKKYYTGKLMTYVNFDYEADYLLRSIHLLELIPVSVKVPPGRSTAPNEAYLIVAKTVEEYSRTIIYLTKEGHWNPYARFLITIKSLETHKLKDVFDILLILRVKDVVVVNGTNTGELYTYNPYENYACGKFYSRIIEYGKCLEVTTDIIYPEKVVTGVKNCFFNVSAAHWPPFSVNPSLVKGSLPKIGVDQYVFHLMSEIEQFKYKFNYDYDPEMFSEVSSDMLASGPLALLANNHTDVMLGGLLLIPSRAKMFLYISGHLDYIDEIRVMVKKAPEVPAWKNFYREFSLSIWALLLISFILYSVVVAILLRAEDKTQVLMILLHSLTSHGSKFQSRNSVMCIFIIWVWTASLINSFYTTSLFSLTAMPGQEYQIHDEQTLLDSGLKLCLSQAMERYRNSESNLSPILNSTQKGCETLLGSIQSVVDTDNRLFTMVLYSIYLINKQRFYDEYGRSQVYSFRKPYAKAIYAFYFYKGFPMYERLHMLALRIRETGLSDKNLNDQYYSRMIRYHFHSLGSVSHFAIPWGLFAVGLFISSVTFGIELTCKPKTLS